MPALTKYLTCMLLVFLMGGCAEFNTAPEPTLPAPDAPAPVQSEADELFAFGANMAKMTAASRDEVCLGLLKLQKNGRAPADVALRLMIGRLLSDACGDIAKILDAVAKTPVTEMRLQQLVLMDSEALKRLSSVNRKTLVIERKAKATQAAAEAKASKDGKEVKDAKDDEARLLREKLEAIRSMEKRMDEGGDAK